MTPPVQKNHYAIGHKYTIYTQVPKLTHVATFIGEYRHEDGTVSHIFGYAVESDSGLEHVICNSFRDENAEFWVGE